MTATIATLSGSMLINITSTSHEVATVDVTSDDSNLDSWRCGSAFNAQLVHA